MAGRPAGHRSSAGTVTRVADVVVTRRRLLLGAAALPFAAGLAGCSQGPPAAGPTSNPTPTGTSSSAVSRTTPPAPTTPTRTTPTRATPADATALTTARLTVLGLAELAEAAASADAALTDRLEPVIADHSVQASVLISRGADPDASPTTSATTPAAVAELAAAEAAAAQAIRALARDAIEGESARLLASVAASCAAHADGLAA